MIDRKAALGRRLPVKGGWRLCCYYLAAQGFFAAHGFAFLAAHGFAFLAAHGFFFFAAQGLADFGAQGFFLAPHGFWAKAGPPSPSARALAIASLRGCLSIFILSLLMGRKRRRCGLAGSGALPSCRSSRATSPIPYKSFRPRGGATAPWLRHSYRHG